jgi:hypothetical protein
MSKITPELASRLKSQTWHVDMTDLQVSQPVFTLLLLFRFRAATLPAMIVGTRGRIVTSKNSEQTNEMM